MELQIIMNMKKQVRVKNNNQNIGMEEIIIKILQCNAKQVQVEFAYKYMKNESLPEKLPTKQKMI